jgi:hypothetical protein
MGLGAARAGAIDVIDVSVYLAQRTEIVFDGGSVEVTRGDLEDIARAFGFDPRNCPPGQTADIETLVAVALAHHLLGLKPEQFRETGLMLAQRPDTWREFDAARRLGAQTFELQRILLGGLFHEVPK